MKQAYIFIKINDWKDLPTEKGTYWTLNKNPNSRTMIASPYDPSDKANRGFWRATVGEWLKPIDIMS